METSQAYYIQKIKEDLSLKQRANPYYSLRAYARDMGLHSSTLSQILSGKRPLPQRNSKALALKMGLGPKERTLFLDSLHRSKSKLNEIKISELDERFMLDESHHQVIAEWEHYVVLDLLDLAGFTLTTSSVAKRLGITKTRAEVVIQNLVVCGLLKVEAGIYVKAYSNIRTTEDVSSQALKEAHLENLDLAKKKLEEIEVELRDFSATTVALDLEKLPEAKTIIREFRQKMEALLKEGHKTEVYQLAIQFYPMTKSNHKEET